MTIRYGVTFIITILLTLMYMTVKSSAWTMLALIDAATITSLILIIVGAVLFVAGQGFFSGIAYSFRRFFKKTKKTWEMLEENDEEYTVKEHSFSFTTPFLVIGVGLFIAALISAVYIY